MSDQDENVFTIPRLRRVYSATYALLPTTGLKVGDLGYATDRLVLYRWSGAAWEAITTHSSSGTAANRPAAADLPNGSLYYETDTSLLKQVQAGAWVTITQVKYTDTEAIAAVPLKVAKQTVNFDDSSPVTIVTLPAGSIVIGVAVEITTAFAGTTPSLDIGDAGDPDGFLASAYIAEVTPGWYPLGSDNYGIYLFDATDKSLFKLYAAATAVLVTISGSSLTQGVADFYIIYAECG